MKDDGSCSPLKAFRRLLSIRKYLRLLRQEMKYHLHNTSLWEGIWIADCTHWKHDWVGVHSWKGPSHGARGFLRSFQAWPQVSGVQRLACLITKHSPCHLEILWQIITKWIIFFLLNECTHDLIILSIIKHCFAPLNVSSMRKQTLPLVNSHDFQTWLCSQLTFKETREQTKHRVKAGPLVLGNKDDQSLSA